MKTEIFFCLFWNFYFTSAYIVDPGPKVIATKGEIWPKPLDQTSLETFWVVRPSMLKYQVKNYDCDILKMAVRRYNRIVSQMIHKKRKLRNGHATETPTSSSWRNNLLFEGFLDEIHINLTKPCEKDLPGPDMLENYKLTVNASVYIESDSIWGTLRGLESFSQLLVANDNRLSLRINATRIIDTPRYSHRGLLVDTSRHFINPFTLKQIIDGMTWNKLNVFHWHIVDDHSFPYESKTFPELSAQGAYNKHMVYTQDEINQIIEYARLRGIRVLAEFDTPGHTRSWGVAHPEILTACEGVYNSKLGPINPTINETYDFMQKLLAEIVEVFPDEYVHLGGDEVGFECWESSAKINDYMKYNNISTYEMLEEKYIQRIVDMVSDLKHKSIVWQEVFENHVKLAPGTIVHVWTGDSKSLLNEITKEGLPALLSTCWYLDHLQTGGDWRKYYTCNPNDFPGDEKQKKLVLGGEACMWSEVVDNTNILQRIFPRASAAAEKLWSPESVNDIIDAGKRLEEHTCRMRTRGLPAQPPNGPGFCL